MAIQHLGHDTSASAGPHNVDHHIVIVKPLRSPSIDAAQRRSLGMLHPVPVLLAINPHPGNRPVITALLCPDRVW